MNFKEGDKVLITEQTPGVEKDSFDAVGSVGIIMRVDYSGAAIMSKCQRTGRENTFWYNWGEFELYCESAVDQSDSQAAGSFIDGF